MIETLFARASSSARLLEPPLGSYLESLAQTLQGQSYSREVIRSYVYAAHRFGEWLNKQGLPLSAVSDQLISRYIDQFPKRITLAHPYGQRSKLAHGLGHLLLVLRQAGVVAAAKQLPSPTEQWLARYDKYLNQVGGKVAISHIARRALQRAGIAVTHPGAHVFRHTVATEMVRGGASFHQVADVLGHESLQTTAIYAKLDLDSLSQLALPWPGGEQ